MTMSIQFFGAAGEVTGSCHLILPFRVDTTLGKQRLLLDYGLIQVGHKDETRLASGGGLT